MLKPPLNIRLLNPALFTGSELDDYASAWAQHFMVPSTDFARDRGEPDAEYRSRLVWMIEAWRGDRR